MGSINLETVNISETDINQNFYIGSTKSEVKDYIDLLTNTKKLSVESQAQNLEMDGLKNILAAKEQNEIFLTKELEEKSNLIKQLTTELEATSIAMISVQALIRHQNHRSR